MDVSCTSDQASLKVTAPTKIGGVDFSSNSTITCTNATVPAVIIGSGTTARMLSVKDDGTLVVAQVNGL